MSTGADPPLSHPGSTRCAPAVHARRWKASTRLVLADSPDHTRSHAITAHIQHDELRPVCSQQNSCTTRPPPRSTPTPLYHQSTTIPCRNQPQQARRTTPSSHPARHGPHSRRQHVPRRHGSVTGSPSATDARSLHPRHDDQHLDTPGQADAHRAHPSSPGRPPTPAPCPLTTYSPLSRRYTSDA